MPPRLDVRHFLVRRDLVRHGLLQFTEDLLKQHQGPTTLHRRALVLARTLRLVTRRFPRSILHITGAQLDKGRGKAEAGKVAQQKVDFFAAALVSSVPPILQIFLSLLEVEL